MPVSAPRNVSEDTLDTLVAQIDVPIEDRESIDVISPFTGEVIGHVPQATDDDVSRAVAKAREAQRAWETVAPKTRAHTVLRFHDLLLEHVDEITDLIQWEGGKARMDAWKEVLDVVGCARYYAKMTPRVLSLIHI